MSQSASGFARWSELSHEQYTVAYYRTKKERVVFDVIDALEVLGADADLAGASSVRLDGMLRGEGVEPALRAALLEGDVRTLETLLRAPKHLCAFIHTPGEEETPEEEEEEENDDEGDDDDAEPLKGPNPRGP